MEASAPHGSLRRWIGPALAYLAAWWFPLTPIWVLLHPGDARPDGIDGPVSWMMKDDWGKPGSPTGFQLFVPIGVALLVWSRRAELKDAPQDGSHTPLPLLIGCLTLALAHLIHLPALAFAALIGIGVGAVVLVYGAKILPPLRTPLLFWLLMLPPPASGVSRVADLVSAVTIRLAALALKLLHRPAELRPHALDLGGFPLEIGFVRSLGAGGIAGLLIAGAILLLYGLYRRRPPRTVVALVFAGAALSFLLNLLRVVAAALLRSERVRDIDIWLLAVPAAALVILAERRFFSGRRGTKS